MVEEPKLVKHKSVRESLQFVADHPQMKTAPIDTPVWELVARILFDLANSPDAKVRGSMTRARVAQKMIADRLVGTRRAGSHPAAQKKQAVSFVDLTQGVVTE